MPFLGFRSLFPEEADRTIRCVHTDGDVYSLVELYCDEVGCDCRRVIFFVYSRNERRELGRVSFGWEPAQFYRDWGSYPMDDADIEELKGPGLQRLAPQSERAADALRFVKIALSDATYVDRIKRHYRDFRAVIDRPRHENAREAISLRKAQVARRRSRRRATRKALIARSG